MSDILLWASFLVSSFLVVPSAVAILTIGSRTEAQFLRSIDVLTPAEKEVVEAKAKALAVLPYGQTQQTQQTKAPRWQRPRRLLPWALCAMCALGQPKTPRPRPAIGSASLTIVRGDHEHG